jgi:hypothetical protein
MREQFVEVIPHGVATKDDEFFDSPFDFAALLREWIATHPDRRVVSTTWLPDQNRYDFAGGLKPPTGAMAVGEPYEYKTTGHGWLMVVYETGS